MAFSLGGKWAIVGGGIGLAGGVTLALAKSKRRRRPGDPDDESRGLFPDLPALEANEAVCATCFELAEFRHIAPKQFHEVCAALNAALEIGAKASAATRGSVQMAWPGMCRHASYRGTEALRLMEMKIQRAGRDATRFGELAGEIQATFDATQYNVAMEVSAQTS